MLVEEKEEIYFANKDGKEIFSLSPMFMEDANEKYSNEVSYDVERNDNSYTLTVTADKEFLNSPDTVYPVRIDPTFNTTGSSYTSDSFVANRDDAQIDRTDDNYYLYDWLRTGKDTTYGLRETFIRFKLPSGYRYDGITAATLKLKLYSKGSGTNRIKAYNVDDYCRSNEVKWENKPDRGSTSSNEITISSNWYNINVIDMIEDCYHQEWHNYGFIVADLNTISTDIWGTFYSSDSSSSSYRPVLSITYTNITGYQVHNGD